MGRGVHGEQVEVGSGKQPVPWEEQPLPQGRMEVPSGTFSGAPYREVSLDTSIHGWGSLAKRQLEPLVPIQSSQGPGSSLERTDWSLIYRTSMSYGPGVQSRGSTRRLGLNSQGRGPTPM